MEALLKIAVLMPAGFWLLAKGGDKLVCGSAEVAHRRGLSPILVGLTIVAWATSAPELVVSGVAAHQGNTGIAMGNVLGSNVANIGLVLGVSALVLPAILGRGLALREAFWLMASLAALWWVCGDEAVSKGEAVALLAIFVLYNVHLALSARKHPPAAQQKIGSETPWRDIILGSFAIAIGAKLIVMGATEGAGLLGISDRVIGLTVVAFGTSLPELAAGLSSAFKGEGDISLGNVVGSNVFNSLVVIGVIALFVPFDSQNPELGPALRNSLDIDFPIALGFSLAALVLPIFGGARVGRVKSGILLLGYSGYILYLFTR